MSGMTENVSAFRARMRDASTPANPLRRTTASAVAGGRGAKLSQDRARFAEHTSEDVAGYGIVFRDKDTGKITGPERGSNLADLLLHVTVRPLVVDTRRTLDVMLRSLDRRPGLAVDGLSRIPGNPYLVVADEALARLFWLPEEPAARSRFIEAAWPGVEHQVAAIFSGTATEAQQGLCTPFNTACSAMLGALTRASEQFGYATFATNLWSAYTTIDPVGLVESTRTGDGTLIRPAGRSGATVRVVLDGPTRLKEGRTVGVYHPTSGHRYGWALLDSMDADGDQICAMITTTPQSRQSLGLRTLHQAAGQANTRFVLAEKPYTNTPTPMRSSHWARQQDLPTIVRDVPLEVALAGAVTG